MSPSAPEPGSTSPSFSCLWLVPCNQAVNSFKGPGLAQDTQDPRPQPSTQTKYGHGSLKALLAQKDYLRNANGCVQQNSSAPACPG